VHPVHLCREFRRHYDQTIGGFIRQRRVEVAAERIALDPDEGLTNIAMNCGFASHAHFSTVFHKLMGVTPSEYRRNLLIRRK
jgi:AraC family transcriptional regulator